jgi:hypothetical protein
VAVYDVVLLLAAIAYYIRQSLVLAQVDPDSALASSFRRDFKGKLSPVLYAAGIGASFISPTIAACVYTLVALIWFIPDQRIERTAPERES